MLLNYVQQHVRIVVVGAVSKHKTLIRSSKKKSNECIGVNFINILRVHFSYESFSLVTLWQKSTFVPKTRA